MMYRVYPANGRLSPFVKCYWHMELDLDAQTVYTDRIVPSGDLQMMFHYGTPFRQAAPSQQSVAQPSCLLCGQQTAPKDVISSGSVGMIAVVFYPYALSAFLPVPAHEFTDRTMALDDCLADDVSELQARIGEAADVQARIALVESFLLSHLAIPDNLAIAREAVAVIARARGTLSVAETAARLHVSKRQLERIFMAHVGIPPKKYGRIVRFNASVKLFNSVAPLTTLAYAAGYCDQSHLIRDYRQFTGLSPREFFKHACPPRP